MRRIPKILMAVLLTTVLLVTSVVPALAVATGKITTINTTHYFQSYANWIEAEAHLAAEGSTFETPNGYQQQSPWVSIAQTNQKNMLRFCTEFGLTPSSRSRIVVENTSNPEADDMEALLGGDG